MQIGKASILLMSNDFTKKHVHVCSAPPSWGSTLWHMSQTDSLELWWGQKCKAFWDIGGLSHAL